MTLATIRWGLALVSTVLAQIVLIALSIAFVAVYSYAIHTGETPAFYSEFARTSGPWVSLIAGGPVFFMIARWIRRRAPSVALRTAMVMVGFYLVIEVAVLLAWPGGTAAVLPFVLCGLIIKAIGAWLGAGGIAARASAKPAV